MTRPPACRVALRQTIADVHHGRHDKCVVYGKYETLAASANTKALTASYWYRVACVEVGHVCPPAVSA